MKLSSQWCHLSIQKLCSREVWLPEHHWPFEFDQNHIRSRDWAVENGREGANDGCKWLAQPTTDSKMNTRYWNLGTISWRVFLLARYLLTIFIISLVLYLVCCTHLHSIQPHSRFPCEKTKNWQRWKLTSGCKGPEGTIWEGGIYNMEIVFGGDEDTPPRVKFTTEMFHPHINKDGVPFLAIGS